MGVLGQVVQSSTSPVTCSTTPVQSNFKYRYYIFGQQEAAFNDIEVTPDMILVAKFYLQKRINITSANFDNKQHNLMSMGTGVLGEEALVAWGAIPLMVLRNKVVPGMRIKDVDLSINNDKHYDDVNKYRINEGTHNMRLFVPPVPEPGMIPTEEDWRPRDWNKYGKSRLRLHVFCGQSRFVEITPSEDSSDDEQTCPEYAWVPFEQRIPPNEPFEDEGFDLYIDGCRFLPDSSTVTRVAARILDRNYDKFGKDIVTSLKLDSLLYDPVYEHRHEVRQEDIPNTATIMFKVYTVDRFYKTLTVIGYALLNIFTERGTHKQPITDQGDLQISLNEGAHQLRLYSQGPDGVDPLQESLLRETGIRHLPCASLLVRLVRAPIDAKGRPMRAEKVPQKEWSRVGLYHPRPVYNDRVYYSMKCAPTIGESKLFHSHMKRPQLMVREGVKIVAKGKEHLLKSDYAILDYIKNLLTRQLDATPMDVDLTYISEYSPKHGIKVAIDNGMNLAWINFTQAQICLNPPGAFYMGVPHGTYDKPVFTQNLDLDSSNKAPRWRDGFFNFPNRSYHRYLTVIFHLQELSITISGEKYKYGLLEQAWTAVQVFSEGYAFTQVFQLPLFQGCPSQNMLKQLAREPCKQWMQKGIKNGNLRVIDGASIFVRLTDGRRDDELTTDALAHQVIDLNNDYIPEAVDSEYSREIPGIPLSRLIPPGKSRDEVSESLAVKFKTLVYKLYEDEEFG